MIRIATLATLAAAPAFAHSGHGAPTSHTHLEEFVALAIAACIAVAAVRFWRAR